MVAGVQKIANRWIRAAVLVPAALSVASCDSPQVESCEAQLLERLKSPSSYKRISVDEYRSETPPRYHSVTIEYDAANSYGALLRDTERCEYNVSNNGVSTLTPRWEPEPTRVEKLVDGLEDDAMAQANAALANADNAIANATAALEETHEPVGGDPADSGGDGALTANDEVPDY